MALKLKIDKATFETLSDAFKAEYKKVGDNYILDAEDNDDKIELKTARDKEKADRLLEKKRAETAENALKDAQEALEEATNAAAGKASTEVEKLTKAHQKEIARLTKENEEKYSSVKGQLDNLLIDGVADTMAADMFKHTPKIFSSSLIKPRLKIGELDGKPVTVAIGLDGNEMPVENLKKEILANTEFVGILKPVGGATGGGAIGNQGGGNGNGGAENLTQQHLRQAREQGLSKSV